MKKFFKKLALRTLRFTVKSIVFIVKGILTAFDWASWGIQMAMYNITKGKIATKAVREEADRRYKDWEKLRNETQRLLDKEHASGKGIRYIDGQEISFKPFTSKDVITSYDPNKKENRIQVSYTK